MKQMVQFRLLSARIKCGVQLRMEFDQRFQALHMTNDAISAEPQNMDDVIEKLQAVDVVVNANPHTRFLEERMYDGHER